MKAHLMFRDADFDPVGELPANVDELESDLGLPAVYDAMGRGDQFLRDVARQGLLSQLQDTGAIGYRQQVLRDCLAVPDIVRQIYGLAVEAIDREHKVFIGMLARYPDTILHHSIRVLEIFAEVLRRLRGIADTQSDSFSSSGFRAFFSMLSDQLSDEYFDEIDAHLATLKFRGGILMSANVGGGNKGTDYVLRAPNITHRKLSDLFRGHGKFSFTVPDRDEAGHRALSELRGRGINLVANATAQSAEHILGFFRLLRAEVGFYVGCVNLHETLRGMGAPVVEPHAKERGDQLNCTGLYDIALALSVENTPVGNNLVADGKKLVVITGANRGGKSTFLRSMGLASLLMQAGMFVPATAFEASVACGIFTHFKREEDSGMRSGKLDEEMARMSRIVDRIRPGGLLLCNESFASTNEREGSEISRQILAALQDAGIRVLFVTHLYDLSESLYQQGRDEALFLRAERASDGSRSFLIVPGEPLPTSFGPDVYARIFGETDSATTSRSLPEPVAARSIAAQL